MAAENISFEEALETLLEKTAPKESFETLPLLSALNRISFNNITAKFDLPPFDASPFDGFALRHEDSNGASKENPLTFYVTESIYAGNFPKKELSERECARIMTGSPLPKGADCVVRFEDTDSGREKDFMRLSFSLERHQNYRFQGEELRKGESLVKKGERLNAFHIGLLAGQGFSEISVFTRPKIGILSTGNELVRLGETLEQGKIYDANGFFLGARTLSVGGFPILSMAVSDNIEKISFALENLMENCDFIVSTGGLAEGEQDYMIKALEKINAERIFRKVRMKPGAWVTAYYKNSKIILSLSGKPKPAMLTFDLFARPLIKKLSGDFDFLPKRTFCTLKTPLRKDFSTRRFSYGLREGDSVSAFSSFSLGDLVKSNSILDIKENSAKLNVGDSVETIVLEN
jgi:molybdopterin molybdotransferase